MYCDAIHTIIIIANPLSDSNLVLVIYLSK